MYSAFILFYFFAAARI